MRRIKPTSTELPRMAAGDPAWKKHYPALLSFLADSQYDEQDGGGKRELGMMSLWAGNGLWHAKLRDNDSGHCCYVAGETLDALFKAADACCSDPAAGWKPEATGGQRRKK